MSKLLESNKNFLNLILHPASKIQAEALLDTATRNQIKSLEEISRNLLSLPLNVETEKIINKRKSLLKKIAENKVSIREKGKIISRYRRSLLDVLFKVKDPLSAVVNSYSVEKEKDISEDLEELEEDLKDEGEEDIE